MVKHSYSVIVPTYNEEGDIHHLLEAILKIRFKNIDFIFVDDSSDRTPSIIDSYRAKDPRIKIIIPPVRNGRCEARNLGIKSTNSDVLVILNADVLIDDDYFMRIDEHYNDGADALIIRSKVFNLDNSFSRYVEAVNLADYYENPDIELDWSEGYSCRRKIALDIGLFPAGYPVQICAGEDAEFGKKLRKNGANIARNDDIVVYHFAPSTFKEFWNIRVGRGRGSPQVQHFILGRKLIYIWIYTIIKFLYFFIKIILVFPVYLRAKKLSDQNAQFKEDTMNFFFVEILVMISFIFGNFQELLKISVIKKNAKN